MLASAPGGAPSGGVGLQASPLQQSTSSGRAVVAPLPSSSSIRSLQLHAPDWLPVPPSVHPSSIVIRLEGFLLPSLLVLCSFLSLVPASKLPIVAVVGVDVVVGRLVFQRRPYPSASATHLIARVQ